MGSGLQQNLELYRLPDCHGPFSSLSHLLGAVAFLILGFVLLRRGRGDRARVALLGIYVGSCVFLLSMSGAVLVGAFFHWRFIWQFATGEVAVPRPAAGSHSGSRGRHKSFPSDVEGSSPFAGF